MARYPQGQDVRISATIRDATGALANASAALITLRNPAATITTYTTPTNDGVGLYHLDFPHADVSTIGHYQWLWDATVSGFHALLPAGAFDVYDPLEVTVLSLSDAKDALNIPQATVTDDEEIRLMIASIQAGLERMTGGPILTTQVTERADMDGQPWEIRLCKRPVVAVTSITDMLSGTALDVSALDIASKSAMVRRKDGQQFFTNTGVVTVVYTAGWGTAVPPGIGKAAAFILQHLWETQRGPAIGPTFGGLDDTALTPPGLLPVFRVPRVVELMAPYVQAGGVG